MRRRGVPGLVLWSGCAPTTSIATTTRWSAMDRSSHEPPPGFMFFWYLRSAWIDGCDQIFFVRGESGNARDRAPLRGRVSGRAKVVPHPRTRAGIFPRKFFVMFFWCILVFLLFWGGCFCAFGFLFLFRALARIFFFFFSGGAVSKTGKSRSAPDSSRAGIPGFAHPSAEKKHRKKKTPKSTKHPQKAQNTPKKTGGGNTPLFFSRFLRAKLNLPQKPRQ